MTLLPKVQELKNWENAIKAIPFPQKDYWIEKHLDPEEKAVTAIKTTYQFVNVDDDTWFWLGVVFLKDGTAKTHYLCNYSLGEEDTLLPILNEKLESMGFKPMTDMGDDPYRKMKNWQEGYDLLCDIARTTKVQKGKFETQV